MNSSAKTLPDEIAVQPQAIEPFASKWEVSEIALSGSVLRDDFRPESDVDVLTRRSVELSGDAAARREIMKTAEVIYARPD